MNYKIPYTVSGLHKAPEIGCTSLDGEIGSRFDRLIYERVSSDFAIDEILREAEDCFADKFDDEYLMGYWRGEFWGKLILSACRVCRYKGDEKLKAAIKKSAFRMLSMQDSKGFLSTYRNSANFKMPEGDLVMREFGWRSNWNIWSRKYTMWGMLECALLFNEPTLLHSCVRMADHLIDELSALGVRIKETGCMDGMPACSIMKPMLVLYRLTGNERYLAFCLDIAKEWDRDDNERPNLIRNALSDVAPAHWYNKEETGWVAKAYEMMSCFDGLCELYRVTGTERYLDACRGLYRLLVKYEYNILGNVGYCEHFNDGAAYPDSATEICDAIHWMRLCWELFRLTGEAYYMESFEDAYLNAFLAGLNEDGRSGAFFVRSSGRHWNAQMQCDTKYQHCCLNNMPRGFVNAAEASVTETDEGYFVNLYSMSTAHIGKTLIRVGSGYENNGRLRISVRDPECGKSLFLRIPSWSADMTVTIGEETKKVSDYEQKNGYARIPLDGELVVRLQFDMTPRVIDFGGEWRDLPDTDYHVNRWTDGQRDICGRAQMVTHPMAHIRRGPVLLARSKRVGATEADMFDGKTVFGKERTCTAFPLRSDRMLSHCRVQLTSDGVTREYIMCDFASAANRDLEDAWYFTVFV